MLKISNIVSQIDSFVWGPVMLVLLVGTGVLLTVRCNFLTWRNLPWALKKTLSKEARTKSPKQAEIHIHTKAPAPPETIAVATPTIFPVPIVAASAVVSAENGERSTKKEKCPAARCIQ